MNHIIFTSVLLFSICFTHVNAQIAIGKNNVTNNSVLLEFQAGNKGIIVPQVSSATSAQGGTFIFDSTDNFVKVREGRNGEVNSNWTNLTSNTTSGVAHSFSNAGNDVSSNNGVVIGSETTSKSGVLVLESTTRALVLPHVSNPHTTLKNAIAGTILYDTASGTLAVYDGANWSYWK